MSIESSASVDLSAEQLEEYEDLTFLSRRKIIKARHVFREMLKETGAVNDEVPTSVIMEMDELAVNPFRDRICSVFSNKKDYMTFEDFLDMISVLSDRAPVSVKAEYAFRIYDFDEDSLISKKDIRELIDRLCYGLDKTVDSGNLLTDDEVDELLESIFEESDFDRDDNLSFSEFEHIISRTPDFANSFRIRF